MSLVATTWNVHIVLDHCYENICCVRFVEHTVQCQGLPGTHVLVKM